MVLDHHIALLPLLAEGVQTGRRPVHQLFVAERHLRETRHSLRARHIVLLRRFAGQSVRVVKTGVRHFEFTGTGVHTVDKRPHRPPADEFRNQIRRIVRALDRRRLHQFPELESLARVQIHLAPADPRRRRGDFHRSIQRIFARKNIFIGKQTRHNFRHRGDRIGIPRVFRPENVPRIQIHKNSRRCADTARKRRDVPLHRIAVFERLAEMRIVRNFRRRNCVLRGRVRGNGRRGIQYDRINDRKAGGVRIIHIAPRNGFLRNRGPLCLRFRKSTRLGIHAGKKYHRMNEHYYRQNNKDGAVLLHFQPLTFPSSFIALLSAVTSA